MNRTIFLIVFISTFVLLSLVLLIGSYRRNNPHWLGKNPLKVQAKVILIEELHHTTKSFEEQIGYQVHCEWSEYDQVNPQIFLSDILFERPTIAIGTMVDVYLSTKEPGRYHVQL